MRNTALFQYFKRLFLITVLVLFIVRFLFSAKQRKRNAGSSQATSLRKRIFSLIGGIFIVIGTWLGGSHYNQVGQPISQVGSIAPQEGQNLVSSATPTQIGGYPPGTVVTYPNGTKISYLPNGQEKVEPPPDVLIIREERMIMIERWASEDPKLKNQKVYGEHLEQVKQWLREDPNFIKDLAAMGLQTYIPDNLESVSSTDVDIQ